MRFGLKPIRKPTGFVKVLPSPPPKEEVYPTKYALVPEEAKTPDSMEL